MCFGVFFVFVVVFLKNTKEGSPFYDKAPITFENILPQALKGQRDSGKSLHKWISAIFILSSSSQEIQSKLRCIPNIYPRISTKCVIISICTVFRLWVGLYKLTGNLNDVVRTSIWLMVLALSGKYIWHVSFSGVKPTVRTQRKTAWWKDKWILADLFRTVSSTQVVSNFTEPHLKHGFLHF